MYSFSLWFNSSLNVNCFCSNSLRSFNVCVYCVTYNSSFSCRNSECFKCSDKDFWARFSLVNCSRHHYNIKEPMEIVVLEQFLNAFWNSKVGNDAKLIFAMQTLEDFFCFRVWGYKSHEFLTKLLGCPHNKRTGYVLVVS